MWPRRAAVPALVCRCLRLILGNFSANRRAPRLCPSLTRKGPLPSPRRPGEARSDRVKGATSEANGTRRRKLAPLTRSDSPVGGRWGEGRAATTEPQGSISNPHPVGLPVRRGHLFAPQCAPSAVRGRLPSRQAGPRGRWGAGGGPPAVPAGPVRETAGRRPRRGRP